MDAQKPFTQLPLLHSPGYRQWSPSNKLTLVGSEDGKREGAEENEGNGDGFRVEGLLLGFDEMVGLLDGFCDQLGEKLGSSDEDGLEVGKTVGTNPHSTSDEHGMQASVTSVRIFFALLTDGR